MRFVDYGQVNLFQDDMTYKTYDEIKLIMEELLKKSSGFAYSISCVKIDDELMYYPTVYLTEDTSSAYNLLVKESLK